MRILMSGSHGLIGAALAERLGSAGHEVVRLVRSGAGPADVIWDPSGGTLDRGSLGTVDAVVHLAGEGVAAHRWSASHKEHVRHSRVSGTRLLSRVAAQLEPRPSVLVSASAIGYYGDRPDQPVTEDDGPGRGFLADVCLAWEAATAPAQDAGIRVVLARTGVVLAPHGGALAKQLPLFRLGLGGRLGSGRQYVSWISLEDEVGAIEFALSADVGGPLNLCGPRPVTNAEFTSTLARVLRRPALMPVPAFALRAALGREMADEMVLSGAQVLPARLIAAGYRFTHPDLGTALRALLGRAA